MALKGLRPQHVLRVFSRELTFYTLGTGCSEPSVTDDRRQSGVVRADRHVHVTEEKSLNTVTRYLLKM